MNFGYVATRVAIDIALRSAEDHLEPKAKLEQGRLAQNHVCHEATSQSDAGDGWMT